MHYSVWNQGSRQYDYYDTPEVQLGSNIPAPKHISAKDLGVPIDHAVWPLPSSAQKTGSGDQARGRIASRKGIGGTSLGAIRMDTNTLGMLGLGVAAFLLWRNGFLQ